MNEAEITQKIKEIFGDEFHGHPMFYKILAEMAMLHSRKNQDYASKEKPLQNFERVAMWCKEYNLVTLGNEEVKVAIIYMLKQLDAALKLLMTGQKAVVEGIPKRLRDVAVYTILEEIILEETKKQKPSEEFLTVEEIEEIASGKLTKYYGRGVGSQVIPEVKGIDSPPSCFGRFDTRSTHCMRYCPSGDECAIETVRQIKTTKWIGESK